MAAEQPQPPLGLVFDRLGERHRGRRNPEHQGHVPGQGKTRGGARRRGRAYVDERGFDGGEDLECGGEAADLDHAAHRGRCSGQCQPLIGPKLAVNADQHAEGGRVDESHPGEIDH